MPANHESILWIVERTSVKTGKHVMFVFRTKRRANEYIKKKEIRPGNFRYLTPQRAVWGPE